MSIQEIRNDIIRELIPKLMKSLTGFKDDDENLQRCELFAWSIIRNHRNLSVNSHEVRRRIEAFKEKFRVDNHGEYGEYLERLCNAIINHPVCTEHYELDVHWSVVDFLLSVSHNPTTALRKNKHKFDLEETFEEPEEKSEMQGDLEDLKAELQALTWPEVKYQDGKDDDDEMSDWTDLNDSDFVAAPQAQALSPACPEPPNVVLRRGLKPLRPPQRDPPFQPFLPDPSNQNLEYSVQHTWWQESAGLTQEMLESPYEQANFARVYHEYLERKTFGRGSNEPSTISEHLVQRELIWLFHQPVECKIVTVRDGRIQMRPDVTLPSVTGNCFAEFVEHHFIPAILMMHRLQEYIQEIYTDSEIKPPRTIECYVANLKSLLEPIWQDLLEYEQRLISEKDFQINTLLAMRQHMRRSFDLLQQIANIHLRVALTGSPLLSSHIWSAYTLTTLLACYRDAARPSEANLAMALFLTTVKTFCMILDTWWREGRLDDWEQEFLVERCDPGQGKNEKRFQPRRYRKDKKEGVFIKHKMSEIILQSDFFQLLMEHCKEAEFTLNLLYEINRYTDFKEACTDIEGNLYETFIKEVVDNVRKWKKEMLRAFEAINANEAGSEDNQEDCVDAGLDLGGTAKENQHDSGCYQDSTAAQQKRARDHLTTEDDFLLLAFGCQAEEESVEEPDASNKDECDHSSDSLDTTKKLRALEMFQLFEESKSRFLPLEEIALQAMSRLLDLRVRFSHKFVLQLYKEEFQIQRHLKNLRKVLLLESSDLMHQFYSHLFQQIESGHSWAHPFLLTMQLDGILSSRFPDMASLFRLDFCSVFNCQTTKVNDAVEEIKISYNLSPELALLISAEDIEKYNRVLRFLLKVKWAASTLHNLRFPASYKQFNSHAPFSLYEALMRRLQCLRFWLIHSVEAIHFHLMTHTLQTMGDRFDEGIARARNIQEIVVLHKTYLDTILKHCLLEEDFDHVLTGCEQLMNLVLILRLEWASCRRHIDKNSSPLSLDSDEEDLEAVQDQIDVMESTYIRVHHFLARRLNVEVYMLNNSFLSPLRDAFHSSVPC